MIQITYKLMLLVKIELKQFLALWVSSLCWCLIREEKLAQ